MNFCPATDMLLTVYIRRLKSRMMRRHMYAKDQPSRLNITDFYERILLLSYLVKCRQMGVSDFTRKTEKFVFREFLFLLFRKFFSSYNNRPPLKKYVKIHQQSFFFQIRALKHHVSTGIAKPLTHPRWIATANLVIQVHTVMHCFQVHSKIEKRLSLQRKRKIAKYIYEHKCRLDKISWSTFPLLSDQLSF